MENTQNPMPVDPKAVEFAEVITATVSPHLGEYVYSAAYQGHDLAQIKKTLSEAMEVARP